MADRATHITTIAAPPERCFEVVTAFAEYPEWARDVKSAEVRARDEAGRPIEVEFTASAMGRSTSYLLRYDWSDAPHRLSWWQVRGDLTDAIDGTYTFSPSTSVPGGTDVVYELAVELVVPLPGFVKRRAEVRILNTVKELKARAEAG